MMPLTIKNDILEAMFNFLSLNYSTSKKQYVQMISKQNVMNKSYKRKLNLEWNCFFNVEEFEIKLFAFS